MAQVAYQQQLVTVTCCNCFMKFGVPTDFNRKRLEDHLTFYCPAGHGQSYTGKTEAQKLREQLAEAERRTAFEQNQRRVAEEQAKKTAAKLKKLTHRVECGVCPHCQRTFKQLAAHMKAKHGAKR